MEKNAGEHTPTPWGVGESLAWSIAAGIKEYAALGVYAEFEGELKGKPICIVSPLASVDEVDRANAEYIIRCVNSHSKLVEALWGCMMLLLQTNSLGDKEKAWTDKAGAALALSEGK